MQTTDQLDAAVEQLIQPPDTASDGATGSDPVDLLDQVLEPTQEAESEEFEEDENEVDESPSDNIEFDGEDDDSDLVEEVAETDNLIPVKVNGKEEMWTLDQLKQSAAGQGYINKRMQEVAQAEKQYKAQAQALAQQQQQVLAFFQQAQQSGVQAPTPPSKELFDTDPIGYMEAKLQYDEAKAQYDTQLRQVQQMKQQQNAQREQQVQAFTQQQAQLLTERLPEIADPQKGEAIKAGLMEVGDYYGFTQDELAGVRDHRYILAMYDAMRYRQLVNKRGKATSQPNESLTPVKAGAKKRRNSGKAAARKTAQSRLQKSGSINDALNLILDS